MCSLVSCSPDGGVAILPSFRSGTGADVPYYLTASYAMSKCWRRAACIPTASLLPYVAAIASAFEPYTGCSFTQKHAGCLRGATCSIPTNPDGSLAATCTSHVRKDRAQHSVCCFFYSSACRRDDCKNCAESSTIRRTVKSHTLISYYSRSGRDGSPALVPLRTYKWQ